MKSAAIKKAFLVLSVMTGIMLLFAVTSFAEDYGSFSYSLIEPSDGEDFEPYIEITGYSESDESTETVAQIPSDIEDVPVTVIAASSFAEKQTLTEVIIPDTVTVIENGAFFGCTSLTTAVIPDSVATIGDSAFQDCSSLEYVIIGDGVTSIGSLSFKNCSSLRNVNLGASLASVGGGAFFGCGELKEIYIPASLTEIGSFAFGFTQGTDSEEAVSGFTFYTDENENLYAYNLQYSGTRDGFTAFAVLSGVKICDDAAHSSLSFTSIRKATDAYDGLDAAVCPECHRIVTRANTDIEQTESTASEYTTLILAIIAVIVLAVLAVLYVKKAKKRRAASIEAYKNGTEMPCTEERLAAKAKEDKKYAEKRKKSLAKLKAYGIIDDDNI